MSLIKKNKDKQIQKSKEIIKKEKEKIKEEKQKRRKEKLEKNYKFKLGKAKKKFLQK